MPGDFDAEWVWLRVDAVKGDRVTATLLTDPCVFAILANAGSSFYATRLVLSSYPTQLSHLY